MGKKLPKQPTAGCQPSWGDSLHIHMSSDQSPCDTSLCWLIGILISNCLSLSLYNWVGFHPICNYDPTNRGGPLIAAHSNASWAAWIGLLMEKKAKDNEGTRCNLNPPHLFFEAKKVDHFLMFRITPPNMDTQNDATFEAGDTFQKPSFLVSMSDFGGKFIVSFARCFLKEISYIKRLL